MKKTFAAVVLAVSLLLCGCTSILEQEYLYVSPHSSTLLDASDPSILRAETYQELVNALVYFISVGTETGTVRLYLDSGQIEAELEQACLEVIQEDPLGAYAVDYIKYSVTPLVAYSEAEVQITYRRTREQVSAIVSATGTPAIRRELESVLSEYASECTLRIGYFDQDETYIHSLVRQAYLSIPDKAMEFPHAFVSIYPNRGRQRIVEITLDYHLDTDELLSRRSQLLEATQHLVSPLRLSPSKPDGTSLAALLLENCSYDPDGGSTAYHALVQHRANAEGLTLAQLLLCKSLSVPCYPVSGTFSDTSCFWSIIETERGWRHLVFSLVPTEDSSLSQPLPLFTDEELLEAGYVWDSSIVPSCTDLSKEPL